MAAITNQMAKSPSTSGSILRRLAKFLDRLTPSNTAEAINSPYQRMVNGPKLNKIGPGEVKRNAKGRVEIPRNMKIMVIFFSLIDNSISKLVCFSQKFLHSLISAFTNTQLTQLCKPIKAEFENMKRFKRKLCRDQKTLLDGVSAL